MSLVSSDIPPTRIREVTHKTAKLERDLENCLDFLADMIDGPRPVLLPLYVRLERELEAIRASRDAMSRVRQRRNARRTASR
ncbi:hypothetical protein [Roseibium sp.]|uniref:hypothetical protein n=1 Tax=Roseibium sp. TaxID=1936156 RepID=UPI003296C8B6